MARVRKSVIIFMIIIILLAIALVIAGYISSRQSFPLTEGVIQLPGLQTPVEVYRDSFGIPHIYAANTHDLFMAQGFIHAQDRFWQMEFWRRIGSGRLAEILGPSALDSDRFIRTVGWHRTAAEEVELLSPDALAVMEAYAEGVNAYLETQTKPLSFEFTILGLTGVKIEPEPWTVLNTLTWAKVMAWDLSGNQNMELLRANVAARLGSDAVAKIVPAYNSDYPVIVPEPLTNVTLDSIPAAAFYLNIFGEGFSLGSNNWVISGERTESGMPLLANDPHLGIDLVRDRSALRSRRAGMSVRCGWIVLRQRARRDHRPQRAHRLGRHQSGSRRAGLIHRTRQSRESKPVRIQRRMARHGFDPGRNQCCRR
jgi:penicillin amidase